MNQEFENNAYGQQPQPQQPEAKKGAKSLDPSAEKLLKFSCFAGILLAAVLIIFLFIGMIGSRFGSGGGSASIMENIFPLTLSLIFFVVGMFQLKKHKAGPIGDGYMISIIAAGVVFFIANLMRLVGLFTNPFAAEQGVPFINGDSTLRGLYYGFRVATAILLALAGLFILAAGLTAITTQKFYDGQNVPEGYQSNSNFTGGLFDLIIKTIIGNIVTTLTGGIMFPWAVCYKNAWFCEKTTISGMQMRFNGRFGDLFGQFIKWWLLTVVTLGIYGFWLNIRFTQWKVKNTSIDGLEGESKFTGGMLALTGMMILCAVITVCSCFILLPFAVCLLEKWKAKHTYYSGRKIRFIGSAGSLFKQYIIWVLLTLVTFGIYGLWLGLKMRQWKSQNTIFDDAIQAQAV